LSWIHWEREIKRGPMCPTLLVNQIKI